MSAATAAGASPAALPLAKVQGDSIGGTIADSAAVPWPQNPVKRARRASPVPTAECMRQLIDIAARFGITIQPAEAAAADSSVCEVVDEGDLVRVTLRTFTGSITFPSRAGRSGVAASSDALGLLGSSLTDAPPARAAAPLMQPMDDDLQLSQGTTDTTEAPARAGMKRSRRGASVSIASSAPVPNAMEESMPPVVVEVVEEDAAAYHLTPPDTPDWLRTQSHDSNPAPPAIPAPPLPAVTAAPEPEPVAAMASPVMATTSPVAVAVAPAGGSAATRTRVRGRKATTASAAHAHASRQSVEAPPLPGLDELLLPASGDAETATRAVVGFLWHRLQFKSAPPARMWAHAAAMTSTHLILCAGETAAEAGAAAASSSVGMSTWTCARATRAWERHHVESLTSSRSWPAHVYIPSSRMLLIHGGESDDLPHTRGDDAADARALTALDTSLMVAYSPTVSGKPPCIRSGHSLVRVRDAASGGEIVVMFGGIRGRQWLNDVWVCTHSTLRWTHVRTSQICPCAPRSYHSAVACGTRMVVLGGNNGDRCFDDVFVLDCTPAFSTTQATTDAHGLQSLAESAHTWAWSKPVCVGGGPCARTGGYAVALNDRFIVYGGGWDPDQAAARTPAPARGRGKKRVEANVVAEAAPHPFRDVFLLDTLTWEWLRVAHDYAEAPPPGVDTRLYADSYAARVGAAALLVEDVEAWTGVRTRPEPRMGIMLTCGMVQENVYDNGVVILSVPDVVARAVAASSGPGPAEAAS